MKVVIIGMLITGLLSFTAASSFAGTSSLELKADITILDPSAILESRQIPSFSSIIQQKSIQDVSVLNTDTINKGIIRMYGAGGIGVNRITATGGNCTGGSGVAFKSGREGFKFLAPGRIPDGGTFTDIDYGATMIVQPNASIGTHTCNYTITVNYD